MGEGMPYRSGRGTAGVPFHVLNRGVRRLALFQDAADYRTFLFCATAALQKVPVRLLAYCVMPNHFHLVVQPTEDGQLSAFMKRLEGTHSKRWHSQRQTAGTGAVYQGRFKAFPIQSDRHFYTVCRYVERNALRAGLVKKAEDWPWGSLGQHGNNCQGIPLSPWPIVQPSDWTSLVNADESGPDANLVRESVATGRPFGDPHWTVATALDLRTYCSLRPRGRPSKTEKTSGVFFGEKDTRRLF
jgi:putative transposase